MARILVMDDTDEIRALASRILRSDGHTVVAAGNGKEGLRLLGQMKADLVITDIVMPEREGLETITEIRRTHPDLPVIAMSGGGAGAAGDYLSIAKALGARRILEKPFGVSQLIDLVREVLGTPPPGDTRGPASPL
ncbi:MAG TPA: response regulator [Gemmatimonadaceae bacterium]|nr:response regulator [Gemmatimonadaceae bacterium]